MPHDNKIIWYRALATLFALGILQICVIPVIWNFRIKPDLLLVFVLVSGFSFKADKFFLLAVLGGLFKDVFAVSHFGLNLFFFLLDAVLVYQALRYINKDTPYLKFILTTGVVTVNYLLLTAIFSKPYILIGFFEVLLDCAVLFVFLKAHILGTELNTRSTEPWGM